MRTATEAFIFAESLCSGSTLDNYATCILNNMRFMPYNKDNSVSLVTNSLGIVNNVDLPVLSGKTFVTIKPVAISDIRARMLQKNDSGQVRFRCLDVFSQPLLPLVDLQDLGLEEVYLKAGNGSIISLTNITSIEDQEPEVCTDGLVYHDGVPTLCLTAGLSNEAIYYRHIYNIRSHIIYLSNLVNEIDTELSNIKLIIDKNGDYNKLLPKAIAVQALYTEQTILTNLIIDLIDYSISLSNPLITKITDFFQTFVLQFDTHSLVQPIIDYITTKEDWTHFLYYKELLDLSVDIDSLTRTDSYLDSFYTLSTTISLLRVMKSDFNVLDSADILELYNGVASKYASEFYNAANTTFNKIQSYSVGLIAIDLVSELARFKSFLRLYSSALFSDYNSTTNVLVWPMITAVDNCYNTGLNNIGGYFNFTTNPTLEELNTFYASKGNATLQQLQGLYTTVNAYLGVTMSTVTEIDLGASFKDSGKYYFANVAYAVGFGTLSNIHQIQIGDNIYDTTSIVKTDGTVVDQVSQEGCTKYRFKQRLFNGVENNSSTQEVEMYIYPGVKNQPFCPTINKYHNIATCKYTGLFTKLLENSDGSVESALFLYKDYEPLAGTVNQLIKLGSADINSIDLTLPTLDQNSSEAFIKRQIVALTGSSALIKDGKLNTTDLKYYLRATLKGTTAPVEVNTPIQHQGLNVPNAANYPYMSIIEFVGLPIGNALKVPEIKILVSVVDTPIEG